MEPLMQIDSRHQGKPVGALCVIEWHRTKDRRRITYTDAENVYISFGDYNEATEEDTFGVPDDAVFYYVEAPEWERLKLGERHHDGWRLVAAVIQTQPTTESQ